jgi:inosose dehydratase
MTSNHKITMKNIPFLFGAEVYTWYMNQDGETYKDQLGHMIEVIAKAGFSGIQPIFTWMGKLSDPSLLEEKLKEQGIELAAVALALPWNENKETEEERKTADAAIDLLKRFPGSVLCTVQIPTGRHNLQARRAQLVDIVNTVSKRAADQGVMSSFHPNSPHSSITRTEEDYKVILESLDSTVTGWCPDVGHIINGDMDPLTIMKTYSSLINHVHYKDWDGNPEFALMGNGKVDLIGITKWLKEVNYSGWIICEDEGKEALSDPDFVTLHDGQWIQQVLIPQIF